MKTKIKTIIFLTLLVSVSFLTNVSAVHAQNLTRCPQAIGYVCNTPTPSPTPTISATPTKRYTQTDLENLRADWQTTNSRSDFNHDGIVSLSDLSILASNWGE